LSKSGTGTLFERISSREGLEDGWRMVLAKDASDGILQRKTKEFAEHLDDFLTELSESLRSGTYEPDPLLSFGIPKGTSGEVRTLHIPSIRDRVVERAVVNAIAHRADLTMSPCSFAYRTGISTDDAVDHLARLRDTGYRYVLRTDIEDYFPSLSIEDALAALSPIAGCPRTIDLIRLIARHRRARGERRTRNRGIAQGSCLSPLLANLALTDVDRAMGDAGYGYARFADDIVICSPHEPDLLEALELLDSLLTPRGLRLNQEKTAMTSFDEGFCYLGQLAGPRSTASARRLLTQASFATDNDARLPLARAIVRAKMRHQVSVLHRTGRRSRGSGVETPCTTIRQLADDAKQAADVDELMGLEGAASTAYFGCLSGLVPPDVAFDGRSRRPPKDLANAALSYAYAILLAECTGALLAAGLEPSLGVLHASTDKRPSLSLDLMEEFRPLLVDRTVLSLLRSKRLRPEHATTSPDGEGVWLNSKGKKTLVDGYEATLQRQVKGAMPGFSGTWRRHIHHGAQLLGRAITEPGYEWTGASWR